jgi:hypothetical protein
LSGHVFGSVFNPCYIYACVCVCDMVFFLIKNKILFLKFYNIFCETNILKYLAWTLIFIYSSCRNESFITMQWLRALGVICATSHYHSYIPWQLLDYPFRNIWVCDNISTWRLGWNVIIVSKCPPLKTRIHAVQAEAYLFKWRPWQEFKLRPL